MEVDEEAGPKVKKTTDRVRPEPEDAVRRQPQTDPTPLRKSNANQRWKEAVHAASIDGRDPLQDKHSWQNRPQHDNPYERQYSRRAVPFNLDVTGRRQRLPQGRDGYAAPHPRQGQGWTSRQRTAPRPPDVLLQRDDRPSRAPLWAEGPVAGPQPARPPRMMGEQSLRSVLVVGADTTENSSGGGQLRSTPGGLCAAGSAERVQAVATDTLAEDWVPLAGRTSARQPVAG